MKPLAESRVFEPLQPSRLVNEAMKNRRGVCRIWRNDPNFKIRAKNKVPIKQ
jgi:hypothetical protein